MDEKKGGCADAADVDQRLFWVFLFSLATFLGLMLSDGCSFPGVKSKSEYSDEYLQRQIDRLKDDQDLQRQVDELRDRVRRLEYGS